MPNAKRGKTKARGNGQGTVFKLEGGGYRWQLTLGFGADGKQQRTSGRAPTKSAAEKALAKAITDHDRGALPAPDKITVQAWLERWLEGKRPYLGETTMEQYETRLRLYVAESLKRM